MEDHVVLDVERLASSTEASSDSCVESEGRLLVSRAMVQAPGQSEHGVAEFVMDTEEILKGKSVEQMGAFSGIVVECRICQEEDDVVNLEAPCACSGSVKYAHRKCVQRWCNEKGDTTCEICQKPYQPGYTAPPRPPQPEGIPIDLRYHCNESYEFVVLNIGFFIVKNDSGNWGITGPHQLDLRDPRILAMAAERHFLDSDYDEYASANASSAACCRSAALILMALLLLRHALAMAASGADDDTSTLFTLFLLRAAGFLLPCYIMLRALSILQRRRQQQEATMAEVAILIQAGRNAQSFSPAPASNSSAAASILPAPPVATAAAAT